VRNESVQALQIYRVGQNRKYTLYMTVYMVNSLPKIPCTHRICMVLANPTNILGRVVASKMGAEEVRACVCALRFELSWVSAVWALYERHVDAARLKQMARTCEQAALHYWLSLFRCLKTETENAFITPCACVRIFTCPAHLTVNNWLP